MKSIFLVLVLAAAAMACDQCCQCLFEGAENCDLEANGCASKDSDVCDGSACPLGATCCNFITEGGPGSFGCCQSDEECRDCGPLDNCKFDRQCFKIQEQEEAAPAEPENNADEDDGRVCCLGRNGASVCNAEPEGNSCAQGEYCCSSTGLGDQGSFTCCKQPNSCGFSSGANVCSEDRQVPTTTNNNDDDDAGDDNDDDGDDDNSGGKKKKKKNKNDDLLIYLLWRGLFN